MSQVIDQDAHLQTQTLRDILQRRKPRLVAVCQAEDALNALEESLKSLERLRTELLTRLSTDSALDRLGELSQESLVGSIQAERLELGKLQSRFARSTINIGVIGRARQGKSKLLQSITGLSRREIPDGSGSHCTGVRSTISHSTETEPHGEVVFHNESSFLEEVLSPYYSDMRLGRPPRSLDEFSTRSLPPLAAELKKSTVAQAKYEHLQRYHQYLPAYQSLIGRPTRRIGLDQVRTFVAQDDEDGNRIFQNYLAVKEVQLFCAFPRKGSSYCSVIDMPGLGDTGVGDQERLVTVLGHDVDAVVFVKLPSPTGDYWGDKDVALFDLAKRALIDLPLEKWSFVVLNRTGSASGIGSNDANCQQLLSSAPSKHIEVTKMIVADCTDPDEVQLRVFAEVVDYLNRHGAHLDDEFAAATQDRLDHLRDDVNQYIAEAAACLGSEGSTEREFTTFDSLFDDMWSRLTNGLEDLAANLRLNAALPNVELAQQVDAAIERARTEVAVPALEDIDSLARRHGAYSSAFNVSLHSLRTRVNDQFQPLESTLRLSLEHVREEVAAKLRDDCELSTIDSASGTEFFRKLATLVPSDAKILATAIEVLCSVDLTYRGFLQYRLRPHLMVLHPDGAIGQEQIRVSANAESVYEALEVLHERAIYRIEEAFDAWLSEPNQVAAAVVEEFVDRALRASGSKAAWRSLYLEHRARIWEAQFDELGDRTKVRQDWNEALDVVKRAAAKPLQVTGR